MLSVSRLFLRMGIDTSITNVVLAPLDLLLLVKKIPFSSVRPLEGHVERVVPGLEARGRSMISLIAWSLECDPRLFFYTILVRSKLRTSLVYAGVFRLANDPKGPSVVVDDG